MLNMSFLRALIILLAFILLFFVVTSESAQKMTFDPVLPEGFKDWPHKFEKSKKVNDKSILTLNIYADKNKEQVLWFWSVNGQIVQSVFLEGGVGGRGLEGKWEEQYLLRNNSGYISYKLDTSAPKDSIKFPTEAELEVVVNIFKGNIKNLFDFDFDEEVEKFEFDSELEKFLKEVAEEEKPK